MIKLNNISLGYDNNIVIKDMSLNIEKGSYVAVPLTDMIGKDVWCITTRSYIAAVICPRQSQ